MHWPTVDPHMPLHLPPLLLLLLLLLLLAHR
jgi:hypothetical protein